MAGIFFKMPVQFLDSTISPTFAAVLGAADFEAERAALQDLAPLLFNP
jgi:hypothetical protein